MLFWFAWVTVIGIPLAILYLINSTIVIQEDVADPEAVLDRLRASS